MPQLFWGGACFQPSFVQPAVYQIYMDTGYLVLLSVCRWVPSFVRLSVCIPMDLFAVHTFIQAYIQPHIQSGSGRSIAHTCTTEGPLMWRISRCVYALCGAGTGQTDRQSKGNRETQTRQTETSLPSRMCLSLCALSVRDDTLSPSSVLVRLLGRRDGDNGGMCSGGGDWRDKQLPALYVDLIEKSLQIRRPLGLVDTQRQTDRQTERERERERTPPLPSFRSLFGPKSGETGLNVSCSL